MKKTKKSKIVLPKPRDATGRVKLLKAIPYKGCMTYIRRIGVDYFEYIVVFDKQVYSNYWILKPDKGKKDLTKLQVDQAAGLAMAGALATVDMHLGAKLDKETEATVSAFEKNRPNS